VIEARSSRVRSAEVGPPACPSRLDGKVYAIALQPARLVREPIQVRAILGKKWRRRRLSGWPGSIRLLMCSARRRASAWLPYGQFQKPYLSARRRDRFQPAAKPQAGQTTFAPDELIESLNGDATASGGIFTVCFSPKVAESYSTASPGARKNPQRLFCAASESVRDRTGTTIKIESSHDFAYECRIVIPR